MTPSLLDWVRRPAYTGPNRCWPCTVVNLAVVAVLGALAWPFERAAALALVVLGVCLVALRGYVVPGTPRFAPRLVARLPVSFGHHDGATGTLGDVASVTDAPSDDGERRRDPATLIADLVEAGALAAEGEDLFLDDRFRSAWRDRVTELREADEREFADRVAGACPAVVEGRVHGDHVFLVGDREVRLRRVVAIAETAAVETLREWGLSATVAARAAPPLRTFLRTCPACGGPVGETTVQHCCGGPGSVYADPELPVLACEECETVVAEL